MLQGLQRSAAGAANLFSGAATCDLYVNEHWYICIYRDEPSLAMKHGRHSTDVR